MQPPQKKVTIARKTTFSEHTDDGVGEQFGLFIWDCSAMLIPAKAVSAFRSATVSPKEAVSAFILPYSA